MRNADTGEQQAQVIVNFGDGADGGTRVVGGALLVDRNGRGKAFDIVHIRLLHLAKELARISRKRLDIAALAFGEDGVEGQGGFAGTGKPGDNYQLVTRDLDGDVLQIVFARPHDADNVR